MSREIGKRWKIRQYGTITPMHQTQNHHHTRHNPHAHRMLQRSAAYLLAQACQMGPQRDKSLWLIPAQPHGAKNAHRASGTSHA